MHLNWFNYKFLWFDGYGRFGLNLIKALLRAGHDIRPYTIDVLDYPSWFQRAQGLDFSLASIMLMPPHEMAHMPSRSFAYTMHESMNLPDGWVKHVNEKAQWLIVPSPWLVDLFRDNGVELPIEVVPGGIDPEECPILPRPRTGPYTFGCLADRASRKGWSLVYTAFYKIFSHDNHDVRLLIKCRPGSLKAMDRSYSRDPRLVVWRADVENVADVYGHMDSFIFPTRCEGYGMPPREAAACGIPTVATNAFGTADDCDKWAFPLNNFKLVESGMEKCGGLWAAPDLDEVCENMLWLYEHQDEAREQAQVKAQWLRENHTTAICAEQLVNVVSKYLGGPVPTVKVHSNGNGKHAQVKERVR